jgi:type I restriction enzyme, S subunit
VESLTTVGEQLSAYRQSLLKYAFEGKLTADWRASNPNKLESGQATLDRLRESRTAACERASSLKNRRGSVTAKPSPLKSQDDLDFEHLPRLPFGWTFVPFAAVAESIKNGISKKPSGTGSARVLRISAVRPLQFDLTDWRATEDEPGYGEYRLHKGDLVFTRYNGSRNYVGVAAVYEGDETHVYPDKLIRCRIARDLADPGYLAKAVNSGQSRLFVESRIRTTAGQAGISGGDVKAIPVPLCPLEEQVLISSILDEQFDKLGSLESEVEESLQRAQALRQSILKQAFSGRLVPQDSNDEPASTLVERMCAERTAHTTKTETPKQPTKGEAA